MKLDKHIKSFGSFINEDYDPVEDGEDILR